MLLALLHDCVWVAWRSGVFQLLLGQPQACPGYSSLLHSPAVKDIDASAAVASPAPRASAASVDTVWIHWFWRSAQHEPWHSQETGLNQGLRMVSDGVWRFTVVYVWRVWRVWCVWCDWCVLTRTLLWRYDAVWIRAGLYSMAVDRAFDMRLAILSRRSEGLYWSANIKNRKLARNISKQHCRHVSFPFHLACHCLFEQQRPILM